MIKRQSYCNCIKSIKKFISLCMDSIIAVIRSLYYYILCIKEKPVKKRINEENKFVSKELIYIEENFNKYLNTSKNKGFVVSLKGDWGIGKTYFWHSYAKKNLKKNRYVYISLFGINRVEQIKERIINKVSRNTSSINKIKRFFGKSKIIGIDISSILSSFGVKNFKNIVICFDDFERISPNLNISEILGFISELKEQYFCKIVIINNTNMLKEQDEINHKKFFKKSKNQKEVYEEIEKYFITQTNNHNIFEKYIEKIVDIDLYYKPQLEDTIRILQMKEEKNFINWDLILTLFSKVQNENKKTNLRYMQKYILKLEVVKEILEDKNVEEYFKNEIFIRIFELVIGEKIDLKYLNINQNNYLNNFYFKELVEKNFIDIKNVSLDIKNISERLENNNKQNKKQKENIEYSGKLSKLYLDYINNLEYKDEDFKKEMYKLILHKKNVINLIGISQLTFYIKDVLMELDQKNCQKLFIIKSKQFINQNFKILRHNFFEENRFIDNESKQELINYYNYLKKEDYDKENESNRIDIKKIFEKIVETRRYNDLDEIVISEILKEEHETKLIEDKDYFKLVFKFMNWINELYEENKKYYSYTDRPFKDFYTMTINIYKELEKNSNYKFKIKMILTDLEKYEDFEESIK